MCIRDSSKGLHSGPPGQNPCPEPSLPPVPRRPDAVSPPLACAARSFLLVFLGPSPDRLAESSQPHQYNQENADFCTHQVLEFASATEAVTILTKRGCDQRAQRTHDGIEGEDLTEAVRVFLIAHLGFLPKELVVVIVSAAPVVELRGGLPPVSYTHLTLPTIL